MWTAKYSPVRPEDIKGREIRAALASSNVLLHGPPGGGKTTLARMMKQGRPGAYLDASHSRGVDDVRRVVKDYCYNPLAVVVMDEADRLTTAAQTALRRSMETGVCRFVIVCNKWHRMDEAVRSRCAQFYFGPLDDSVVRSRLQEVLLLENAKLDAKLLGDVVRRSSGDMRKALNTAQVCCKLGKLPSNVDKDKVFALSPEQALTWNEGVCQVALSEALLEWTMSLPDTPLKKPMLLAVAEMRLCSEKRQAANVCLSKFLSIKKLYSYFTRALLLAPCRRKTLLLCSLPAEHFTALLLAGRTLYCFAPCRQNALLLCSLPAECFTALLLAGRTLYCFAPCR